jgi:redox-sensitive bicupin YhaK (pirin superfamily)
MTTEVKTTGRDAVLVEDATRIRVMGFPVLEALPARRARPAQLVLLGPGTEFAVSDAAPGTRFLLMTGQPYKEIPLFSGPFVD